LGMEPPGEGGRSFFREGGGLSTLIDADDAGVPVVHPQAEIGGG
jgi:hypothetical protein